MLSARLKTKNSEAIFDLPERPDEVKLTQALRFNYCYSQLVQWRDKELPDDQLTYHTMLELAHRREYLEHVITCVAEFFGKPEFEFLGIRKGSLQRHLVAMSQKNLDTVAEDLLSLFTHIYNVIGSYVPRLRKKEDCTFVHNGKAWTIPYFLLEFVNTGTEPSDLTVAESIECLEVKRLVVEEKAANEKKALTGDALASATVSTIYTEIVNLTAILARQEGEVFPDDPYEADLLVEERKAEFGDIDYANGSDLAFFFGRYESELRADPANRWYFNPPQPTVTNSQESEWLDKVKRENEAVWRRSGYKGLYGRLMEPGSDYFTVPGVSKIVSIRQAPMRTALRLISMENSM